MRIVSFIFLLLICSFKSENKIKYELIFPDDYSDAKQFIRTNQDELKNSSFIYRHGFLFSTAIVFPEIMRYSVIKDIIETTALELVYVNNGTDAADFSIGRFQMKPSFIESLENEINNDDSLSDLYKNALLSKNLTEKEKRQIRVERLKNNKWQIFYLHAFIAICDKKFNNQLFKNINEKLVLYSTAYNSGFYNSIEILKKNSVKKNFPYGSKYEGTQYGYSDISNYYFTNNH